MSDEKQVAAEQPDVAGAQYVAPVIETVVTPETLGREVQYAGFSSHVA